MQLPSWCAFSKQSQILCLFGGRESSIRIDLHKSRRVYQVGKHTLNRWTSLVGICFPSVLSHLMSRRFDRRWIGIPLRARLVVVIDNHNDRQTDVELNELLHHTRDAKCKMSSRSLKSSFLGCKFSLVDYITKVSSRGIFQRVSLINLYVTPELFTNCFIGE